MGVVWLGVMWSGSVQHVMRCSVMCGVVWLGLV